MRLSLSWRWSWSDNRPPDARTSGWIAGACGVTFGGLSCKIVWSFPTTLASSLPEFAVFRSPFWRTQVLFLPSFVPLQLRTCVLFLCVAFVLHVLLLLFVSFDINVLPCVSVFLCYVFVLVFVFCSHLFCVCFLCSGLLFRLSGRMTYAGPSLSLFGVVLFPLLCIFAYLSYLCMRFFSFGDFSFNRMRKSRSVWVKNMTRNNGTQMRYNISQTRFRIFEKNGFEKRIHLEKPTQAEHHRQGEEGVRGTTAPPTKGREEGRNFKKEEGGREHHRQGMGGPSQWFFEYVQVPSALGLPGPCQLSSDPFSRHS